MKFAEQIFLDTFSTLTEHVIAAPINRVPISVCNRVFPTTCRDNVIEPELPPNIQHLPESIFATLPLAKLAQQTTKTELYDTFASSITLLQNDCETLVRFIAQICECNVMIKTQWMDDKKLFEVMKDRIKKFTAELPEFRVRMPNVLNQELEQIPSQAMVRLKLEAGLRDECHKTVKDFCKALDKMVDLEQVGIVEWKPSNCCDYHYFTNNVERTVTGQRTKSRLEKRSGIDEEVKVRIDEKETDLETTYSHSRHIHQLIMAKKYSISAARKAGIPIPPRVESLIANIPNVLKEDVHIVAGQLVSQLTITRDLETASSKDRQRQETEIERVYKPDPALTFAFYSLTGWSDAELNPSSADKPLIGMVNEPKLLR